MTNTNVSEYGDSVLADHIKIKDLDNNRILLNRRGNDVNQMISDSVKKSEEHQRVQMLGHIKIIDKTTNEILIDKDNAIHYENMSITMAKALSNDPEGVIQEMHFGNGGSTISGTGIITYFPPNVTGSNSDLYNQTYYKVINDKSSLNLNTLLNNITISHTNGVQFTDILITCTLDNGEPSGQAAFDDINNLENQFVFDELGLRAYNQTPGQGLLLTHVVFSPVQKSLNRVFEIQYTIRISICS